MLDQMSGGRSSSAWGRAFRPIETSYYGLDPENSDNVRENRLRDDDESVRHCTLALKASSTGSRMPRSRSIRFRNRIRRSGTARTIRRALIARRSAA